MRIGVFRVFYEGVRLNVEGPRRTTLVRLKLPLTCLFQVTTVNGARVA